MKPTLLALCLLSPAALACDTSHLSLSGTLNVTTCSPQQDPTDCVYSGNALHAYLDAVPDDDSVFTIGLHASPWRMYDGDMRIVTIDDIAEAVRPKLDGTLQRVELIGSWTGVSPAKDGTRRTTRQAFTTREGAGSYFLPKGAEVFAPLVAGWPTFVQDQIPEDDAEMLTRAAAGADVFFLCPEKALAGFEHAAQNGSAIGAYNAALMRLERAADGDRAAALALLERGAALGDVKSRERLTVELARN